MANLLPRVDILKNTPTLGALDVHPAKTPMDAYYDVNQNFVPEDQPIPLQVQGEPNAALFLPKEDDRPLTKAEKSWVQEAQNNPELQQAPPSAPALRALGKQLERYAGPMPASKEQWQNYVMQQYYLQSLDTDPKVSKPALDSLAKTSIVGLHEERKEVSLEIKTNVELQSEALALLRSIAARQNEKVIEHADVG